jgi:hypothetical protein
MLPSAAPNGRAAADPEGQRREFPGRYLKTTALPAQMGNVHDTQYRVISLIQHFIHLLLSISYYFSFSSTEKSTFFV